MWPFKKKNKEKDLTDVIYDVITPKLLSLKHGRNTCVRKYKGDYEVSISVSLGPHTSDYLEINGTLPQVVAVNDVLLDTWIDCMIGYLEDNKYIKIN